MLGLPDKGEKLKNFVKRLDAAITCAAEVDTATELMRNMSINNADSVEIAEQLRGVLNTRCDQKIVTTMIGPSEEEKDHCLMKEGIDFGFLCTLM